MAPPDRRTFRSEQMDPDTRLALLEMHADNTDTALDRLATEMAGIRHVLTGLLISITSGVIVAIITFILTKG